MDVLYKIADIVEVQYFDTHDTLEVKENTLYIISNGSVKFLRKNAGGLDNFENVHVLLLNFFNVLF